MKKRLLEILDLIYLNGSKILKKILRKSAIALSILSILLLLKLVNLNFTNNVLANIKNTINYEFNLTRDSIRVFNKAKKLATTGTHKVLEVFHMVEIHKYPAPIDGLVHRHYHKDNPGVDIKSTEDFEARAITDGIVKDIHLTEKKGYFITIESSDFQHIYGYLSKPYVSIGDKVEEGDLIGYLGTSKDGNKYLRLEILKDGKYQNPIDYIEF